MFQRGKTAARNSAVLFGRNTGSEGAEISGERFTTISVLSVFPRRRVKKSPCRRRNRVAASACTRERAGDAGDDDDFAVIDDAFLVANDDLTVAVETSGRC